jgi:hypothetical protein
MEEKPAYQNDIASIRELMERSTKFISLSGLSGILAGLFALAGAGWAYWIMDQAGTDYSHLLGAVDQMMLIALVVLIVSIGTGVLFTARRAKNNGTKLWNSTSRRLFINLAIPLVTGGIFVLTLFANNGYFLIPPSFLIFYGLALVNASPNMYEEVRYLGYIEIALGLIAATFPSYGLLFWAIGFGVLHILYGALMYKKYEAKG